MDKIDGWSNEDWEHGECVVGARFAACYWIHTKAVEVREGACELREDVLMQSMNRLRMQVAELHE